MSGALHAAWTVVYNLASVGEAVLQTWRQTSIMQKIILVSIMQHMNFQLLLLFYNLITYFDLPLIILSILESEQISFIKGNKKKKSCHKSKNTSFYRF